MHSLSTSPSAIPSDGLTLSMRGKLVGFPRPWVMGILNATPDSFHAPSRIGPLASADAAAEAVTRVGAMLDAGADIIDIGACSTRPGSQPPSPGEEMRRLEAVMPALRRAFPDALLSVDTFRASVARECLERWEVDVINDVSGGADPDMFSVVAAAGATYVLMHMRGTPADMDSRCSYGDVVADVVGELAFRLNEARDAGICNVIVDPGFGFAKTLEQNLVLLKHLRNFAILGCPLLVGMSRKRMAAVSGDTLISTVALNAVALSQGASIIRVHDVPEGVATAQTVGSLWNLE